MKDVGALLDWAAREERLDPTRFAVSGGSYGGYMTNWAVGHSKEFKAAMHGASFELIEIPHVRMSGKNSADIRMVVDALDLCYTKSHVDTFVIVSGDSSMIVDGQPVARHGDGLACTCSLVAAQQARHAVGERHARLVGRDAADVGRAEQAGRADRPVARLAGPECVWP